VELTRASEVGRIIAADAPYRQQVPAERREPEPHVHVDHLYLTLAELTGRAPGAELPFVWYATGQLAAVDMFGDTRARATYLLDRPRPRSRIPAAVPAQHGGSGL